MSDATNQSAIAVPGAFASLAPMAGIVFLGFLAIGAPLPALSLYVHNTLGFSTTIVGWVIGIQSFVTILVRHRSGVLSDHQGPRRAVLLGLPCAALSGVLYLLSAILPVSPAVSLALLLVGRLLIGMGESLFITGCMSWGIARAGAPRTGLVISWQGIAMFAAIGAGAPLGLAVQAGYGFVGVAVVTMVSPLLACAIALTQPGVVPGAGDRVPFYRVIGLIWRPGLVVACAGIPFAAMSAFVALDYAAKGWTGAGNALAGFGVGFIVVRLVGSQWPARFGGVLVCGISLVFEGAGQAILWLAPQPELALVGAVLTGVGFSLVFPSMGVEATRRIPPALRGRAVGNFLAFFDLAMGVTGPVLGLLAAHLGFAAVFMAGLVATVAGLILVPSVRRMGATR